MVAVLELLRRLVEFLGGVGPVLFGIVLLLVAPYVDRLLVRRKRIGFRVLYNSKIGLGPEQHNGGADPAEHGPPQLRQVARLLDRMSMVVIRIRNSGSYDIDPDDFERPLSFTFGGRLVWNARVSDASTGELRERLREGLAFFPDEGTPAKDGLVTVRQRLSDRMARWLGASSQGQPQGQDAEPAWHGVRLDGLRLKRGEKAKLVVVLREANSGDGDLTKVVGHTGKLKDAGLIMDERENRRVTLPRVTVALVIALSALLVLSQLSTPRNPTVACMPGKLRIVGSTVFIPAMQAVADEYEKACGGDSDIATEPTGSIEGVRRVMEAGANAGLVAVADGKSKDHDRLYAEKLAIVTYHVAVNSGVGLNTLSVDDLRKINDGTYTNWNQLRDDKTSLPIRIISRDQDSGTRQLYEQQVLRTGENVLSSNECLEKDRNPAAPVIRCERQGNPDVIRKISTVPGAIGYADEPALEAARKAGTITALTLDGKAFDASTAVQAGYPFWTVEYVYTKERPAPGSLAAAFLEFARSHALAQVRLSSAGFDPCVTKEGLEEACELR
ncbi:PstS family phosphate ABC transporter substrate-binding protein [Nonomuraea turcica]|uniref:PstS family phosphate ABC transporter substrate-binding protein n=1 Tax=Nonomuraea sp. G32 TaxID=3067274 RepID=UPI00273A9B93|nr:substrate-binding domain-containing protein [Nonomuraea sp. G32]MDP4507743.1 substrate-binding domain-containing protein [Nonomuraea sp. G32]